MKKNEGEPIKNVSVNNTKSNEKGYFKTEIQKSRKTDTIGVVTFFVEGYIPKVITFDLNNLNNKAIEVYLEEDIKTNRSQIPACTSSQAKKYVGDIHKLPKPKGAKVKKGSDIDYGFFYISLGKNRKVWLEGMAYFTGSGTFPLTGTIIDSKDFSVRVWENSDTIVGYDWKGESIDGKFWRYFGFDLLGGYKVSYEVDSKESGTYFDQIIENSCIDIPKWLKNDKTK